MSTDFFRKMLALGERLVLGLWKIATQIRSPSRCEGPPGNAHAAMSVLLRRGVRLLALHISGALRVRPGLLLGRDLLGQLQML